MNLRLTLLWGILTLFAVQALAEGSGYTGWVKSSKLTELVKAMDDDRKFPGTVEGRLDGSSIRYRANFIPFLQDMDYFHSRWGMTAKWYQHYSDEYANAGFKEVSHTTFTDASGSLLHQVTWVLVSVERI